VTQSVPKTEPEAVFSEEQWVEIAQSIPVDEIPREMKQAICDALFEYQLAQLNGQNLEDETNTAETKRSQKHKRVQHGAKYREALKQLVDSAGEFRIAIYRLQRFLREDHQLEKVEQLADAAYELQRFAERELENRPKPKGGRPRLTAHINLVDRLGVIYERITGKKPARSENAASGRPTGPFVRLLSTIFEFQGIPLTGIKHVISEAARIAKNPR
jgi:hypothetical protein